MWKSSAPVVAGVDGSDAAINAANWAIDEAISRDVPHRIVHVTHIEGQPAAPEDAFRLDVQYAESSLRAATAAVQATVKPVKIETDVLWGSPDTAQVNESPNASLVCVGSIGIGALAAKIWRSTAESGRKSILPGRDHSVTSQRACLGPDWIAVVVEDHPDNESVIEAAMEEARLSKAPVLAVGSWQEDLGDTPCDALDRRIEKWAMRYPQRPHLPCPHTSRRRSLLGREQGRIGSAGRCRRSRCPQNRANRGAAQPSARHAR